MKNKLSDYAFKTFLALKSESVKDVKFDCIEKIENCVLQNKTGYYIGIKDTDVIPSSIVEILEKFNFFHHTVDKASLKGRAIDLSLKNPITGRYMTGSSSGSAINVFLNINDLAIATDGGGSVLAPALSLNLYAIISPLILQQELRKHSKKSTDNITFTPSIGIISKDIDAIKSCFDVFIRNNNNIKELEINVAKCFVEELNSIFNFPFAYKEINTFEYDGVDRNKMIKELQDFDFENKVLITYEGPIDLYEYGDSIIGHYDCYRKKDQLKGSKYYLKVINMANLSAICIPSTHLSKGILIICKSDINYINFAFKIAKMIEVKFSKLQESYFNPKNLL